MSHQCLFGTNHQPANIHISADYTVQLGTVVGKAFERSGLTVKEWNSLPEEHRDTCIDIEVQHMRESYSLNLEALKRFRRSEITLPITEQPILNHGLAPYKYEHGSILK